MTAPPPPMGGTGLTLWGGVFTRGAGGSNPAWHLLRWFVLPICFAHGLALLSHYFKSISCVYSVMFSLQRCCMGVLCCYFRPKFSTVPLDPQ